MRHTWTVPAILLLFAPAAAAQAPLTLEAALEEAGRSRPTLRGQDAAVDRARARTDSARASWFPRLDLVESWQKSDAPVFVFSSLLSQRRFTADSLVLDALNHPDAISNHRTALTATQIIYDGGRREATARQASLNLQAVTTRREAVLLDVRLDVVRAFARALTASAARAVAVAAVETADEDLRRAVDRRDAGVETEANVLALRVRAAERAAARIKAESDARVAREALSVAIGAPLDDARALVEPAAVEIDGDVATLERLALASRPELKRAALARDAARMDQRSARAGFLPHVSASGGIEANGGALGSRSSAWMAGVEIRLNVFAGGADRARLREAAAAAAEADAVAAELEAAVRLEVRSALAAHRAAVARERTARASIEQARESHRMLRDRYDAGLTPASDLLRAAEALRQAEMLRIDAVGDIHETAGAVARAAGSRTLPTRPPSPSDQHTP